MEMGLVKWQTAIEYTDSFDGKWHPVYTEKETGFGQARSAGTHMVDFGDRIPATYPEAGVFELPQGHVLGPHGWVFDRRGILFPQFSWYGNNVAEMTFPRSSPRWVPIKGTVLSLLSDWASGNYGHFLLDSLSRFHLFQAAGFSINDVTGVLCPGMPNPRSSGFLDKLGIPTSKRIWSDSSPGFVADLIIVPSFPGIRRVYPQWVASFLKQAFGTSQTCRNRRLYVTRGMGTRKVINEQDLQPILDRFGFEFYNPSEHPDPPADFGEAEAIVGAHGAGLTDIVFCPPGGKIMELMPSDHVFPHYYTLAVSASLEYMCLQGKSTHERRKGSWGPSPHDFVVDIKYFEQALSELLQGES